MVVTRLRCKYGVRDESSNIGKIPTVEDGLQELRGFEASLRFLGGSPSG